MPHIVQITLVLWVIVGVVIALIPDLQRMNSATRFILGAPAALGLLWMMVGLALKLADSVVGVAVRLGWRKAR